MMARPSIAFPQTVPTGGLAAGGAVWRVIPSALAYFPAVPVDHSAEPDELSMTTLPSFCTSR